jgi:hypothetical protein
VIITDEVRTRNEAVVSLGFYIGICLEGLRKDTNILAQPD